MILTTGFISDVTRLANDAPDRRTRPQRAPRPGQTVGARTASAGTRGGIRTPPLPKVHLTGDIVRSEASWRRRRVVPGGRGGRRMERPRSGSRAGTRTDGEPSQIWIRFA